MNIMPKNKNKKTVFLFLIVLTPLTEQQCGKKHRHLNNWIGSWFTPRALLSMLVLFGAAEKNNGS
jgi:hypothetical protein